LYRQIKITPFNFSIVKLSFATRKAYQLTLYLQGMKLKKLTKQHSQGFRMENGAMSATKHFSSKWSVSIYESTVRKLNI